MSTWFLTYGFAEASEHLLVGAMPGDAGDVRRLAALGVTAVLNLVEDREYDPGSRRQVEAALQARGITERRLPTQDLGPLDERLLAQATKLVGGWLDAGEIVYLHCRAGWQRSATVAAGVIALRERTSLEEALLRLQRRKPTAEPLPNQRASLARWFETRAAR
jgi:atypical dual specificity phosphatase